MLKKNVISVAKWISVQQIIFTFICLLVSCFSIYADDEILANEFVPQGNIVITAGESKVINTELPTVRVSVTDPKVIDVQVLTPYQLMLQGLNIGSTDVIVWSKDENNIQQWKISVVMDVDTYSEKLKELFPYSSLQFSQSGNVLVVKGLLRSVDQVKQLHDYLDKAEIEYVDMTSVAGVQQVQLQVRVAEVSRTLLRVLGINAFYTGPDYFGASRIGSSGGGALVPSIGVAPQAGNSGVTPGDLISIIAGVPGSNFEAFIQTLAENQYLKMLANPTLVALSGEEANFLAGGEFPIPVVQGGGEGGTSISIEYREYGVRLAFRPIVLGDGTIRLYVAPEVSELTDVGVIIEGYSVPSLLIRKAETTLELKSGQTFAMAGLIKNDVESIRSRVPGVSNLPVLGPLFRSIRYKEKETELVVLVTVALVEPISSSQTSLLPGFMHSRPDDWEFYAEGFTEGQKPPKIHPDDAKTLKEMGLNELVGPGAWDFSDQE